MKGCPAFVRSVCRLLQIRPPPEDTLAGLATPFVFAPRSKLTSFLPCPPLPHCPQDLEWDSYRNRLFIQVDCRGVAEVCNGRAVLHTPYLDPLFHRITNHLLTLCSGTWLPKRDIDDMVIWLPREFNTVADHLVNGSMDMDCAWEWVDEALLQHTLHERGSFKICVDGGLRGSQCVGTQRLGGIGVAIYAASSTGLDETTYSPVFLSAQPLYGIDSAFHAEATALEWALSRFQFLRRE